MLRGSLFVIAVLLGIGFFFSVGHSSSLQSESQWEQARRYLAEGKAAEARTAFEDLLRNYPNEPDLHLFLGIALLRLRDTQVAEIAVRKAIDLDPGHVEARTLLGWIRSEVRGDVDGAIEQYTKVVELRPDFPEAYNNLGVALKKKGESDRAIQQFNRALELRPGYGEALGNRGWIYAQQEKWSEARRDFEAALAINPADEGSLYGLSQALREARDYAGAQKALSRLITQSPNFVYWLEWGRVGLVRYWWVLLLMTLALFFNGRYRKTRRQADGGGTSEKA